MIILTEQIKITAPYEKLRDWINRLDSEFVLWSPNHTKFELLDGGKKDVVCDSQKL